MWFLNRLNGSDCWPTVREGHVSMMKPTAAKPRTRLDTDPLRNILFNLSSASDLGELAVDRIAPKPGRAGRKPTQLEPGRTCGFQDRNCGNGSS